MPRSIIIGLVLALAAPGLALAPPAAAQEDEEWERLAEQGYGDADGDGNGRLNLPEQLRYTELVHVSMDTDESGGLSEQEFASWGFGVSNLAQERGNLDVYTGGLRIMFDVWDSDDDGAITLEEHEAGVLDGFEYADRDSNNLLSQDEYTRSFIYNILARNVLRVD